MTEMPPPGNYPPPPGNYPPPPPGNYPPPPPGNYPPPGGMGGPPDNYLVWAILTTLLCCLPLGVVSIVKSSQVSSLWAQGQYAASQQASADAKKWATWSAIAGVAVVAVYLVISVIGGVALMSGGGY